MASRLAGTPPPSDRGPRSSASLETYPLRHRQSRYLRSLSGSVEPTPEWLVHVPRLHRPAVEPFEVGGVDAHERCGCQSGCAVMNSSARRRSFGVFTVSQTPSWR